MKLSQDDSPEAELRRYEQKLRADRYNRRMRREGCGAILGYLIVIAMIAGCVGGLVYLIGRVF